jgi:hypothetical protein
MHQHAASDGGGASLRFGTGKWTNKVYSPLGEASLPGDC